MRGCTDEWRPDKRPDETFFFSSHTERDKPPSKRAPDLPVVHKISRASRRLCKRGGRGLWSRPIERPACDAIRLCRDAYLVAAPCRNRGRRLSSKTRCSLVVRSVYKARRDADDLVCSLVRSRTAFREREDVCPLLERRAGDGGGRPVVEEIALPALCFIFFLVLHSFSFILVPE